MSRRRTGVADVPGELGAAGALRVVQDGDDPGPRPRDRRVRRRLRRGPVAAGVLVLVAGALAGWRWGPLDHPEVWPDGSAHGPWVAVYNGLGETTYDDGTIELAPEVARTAGETHAGLVVSVAQYGDVDYSAVVHTLEQTRVGSPPNPWEVGWVVWHYTSSTSFYYFSLKPNGWELGKADRGYTGAQRFLSTGGSPTEDGRPHTVRIRQVGATVDVWVDTVHVVTSTDTEAPYDRGSVGVYSEDAVVRFSDLQVGPADY